MKKIYKIWITVCDVMNIFLYILYCYKVIIDNYDMNRNSELYIIVITIMMMKTNTGKPSNQKIQTNKNRIEEETRSTRDIWAKLIIQTEQIETIASDSGFRWGNTFQLFSLHASIRSERELSLWIEKWKTHTIYVCHWL